MQQIQNDLHHVYQVCTGQTKMYDMYQLFENIKAVLKPNALPILG